MRARSTALLRRRVVHADCELRRSRAQYVTIAYCCGLRGVVVHKRHVRCACARNLIRRTAAWLLRANLGAAQASFVLCRAAPCIALSCGAGLLISLALDIRERMLCSRSAALCVLP
ncbi:Ribonuclease P protein component [Candidatus Tremblaya princeps]|uniref:Ribonuclease P protein component n=1 Tax=Tremblaya princeps TaxID=189385 RepID=A0A143WQP9_TREPR|nr:Ribonuclease P protein component [Candidatus Tremblaya princeps]